MTNRMREPADRHRQSARRLICKDRRAKLDPAAFGLSLTRRRTPGLRREEVAQRANVSATWYTWLEQGRGGAASADVLDRIARALMLTEVEREHLFLLGLGRPPEVRYHAAEGVTPRLQRVLDALTFSPAYVKTSTWDVVAWNRAAAVVLTDYGSAAARAAQHPAPHVLRSARPRRADQLGERRALRGGGVPRRCGARRRDAQASRRWSMSSAGSARNSRRSGARTMCAAPTARCAKQLRHPLAGLIALEYSAFAVDGRPDLDMVIYNPATPEDAARSPRCCSRQPGIPLWRPCLSQLPFGKAAEGIGHRLWRLQHHRAIADRLPAEAVADRVHGAVGPPARRALPAARPPRLVGKPERQLQLQSGCASRCDTEIASSEIVRSSRVIGQHAAHQVLGDLGERGGRRDRRGSVSARVTARRSAKRTRTVTVRPASDLARSRAPMRSARCCSVGRKTSLRGRLAAERRLRAGRARPPAVSMPADRGSTPAPRAFRRRRGPSRRSSDCAGRLRQLADGA